MLSRNLEKAKDAWKAGDAHASKAAHSQNSVEHHKTESGQYIKSTIFGGLDGIITTFAVVAGVAGASLSSGVMLILGFANLIADGLSMAIGDYLSTKGEQEYHESERLRELWEVENYPEGEKREMVELYQARGLEKPDAEAMANILSKYKEPWVNVMMVEELGIMQSAESPLKNAIVTFVSFAFFGFLPLLAFVVSQFVPAFRPYALGTGCVLTAATLFVLGALKTRFTEQSWWKAGLEMMIVGGLAAGAAYLVGILLSGLA